MLLGEPARTRYDLNFNCCGFPVRVSPFFWVMGLLLGLSFTDRKTVAYFLLKYGGFGEVADFEQLVEQLPLPWAFIMLWFVALFLSILIHELGHAIVLRKCGISSHIVLYHFGGLAVQDGSTYAAYGHTQQLNSKNQIMVSAAGPAAQLLLACLVFAVLRIGGFRVPYFETAFGVHLPVGTGLPISNALLCMFLFYLLVPSIGWAIFNLAPMYPLDGGHISRELFLLLNPREGIRYSLTLSIATAGGIAIYMFSKDNIFFAVMMGWLGYSSYQILQAYTGKRFGGPGRSSW